MSLLLTSILGQTILDTCGSTKNMYKSSMCCGDDRDKALPQSFSAVRHPLDLLQEARTSARTEVEFYDDFVDTTNYKSYVIYEAYNRLLKRTPSKGEYDSAIAKYIPEMWNELMDSEEFKTAHELDGLDADLTGKLYVVIGGSQGQGFQAALQLARQNAQVVTCARHGGPDTDVPDIPAYTSSAKNFPPAFLNYNDNYGTPNPDAYTQLYYSKLSAAREKFEEHMPHALYRGIVGMSPDVLGRIDFYPCDIRIKDSAFVDGEFTEYAPNTFNSTQLEEWKKMFKMRSMEAFFSYVDTKGAVDGVYLVAGTSRGAEHPPAATQDVFRQVPIAKDVLLSQDYFHVYSRLDDDNIPVFDGGAKYLPSQNMFNLHYWGYLNALTVATKHLSNDSSIVVGASANAMYTDFGTRGYTNYEYMTGQSMKMDNIIPTIGQDHRISAIAPGQVDTLGQQLIIAAVSGLPGPPFPAYPDGWARIVRRRFADDKQDGGTTSTVHNYLATSPLINSLISSLNVNISLNAIGNTTFTELTSNPYVATESLVAEDRVGTTDLDVQIAGFAFLFEALGPLALGDNPVGSTGKYMAMSPVRYGKMVVHMLSSQVTHEIWMDYFPLLLPKDTLGSIAMWADNRAAHMEAYDAMWAYKYGLSSAKYEYRPVTDENPRPGMRFKTI